MSRNLPWMRFFVGDWLNDPRLSLCSPSTRGVWIDLIAAMHIDGREGEITATDIQLARLCRCSPDQVLAALDELESTGAAEVTRAGNGLVTVLCRRMAREAKARSQALERVKRHREKTCNAVVRATRARARARSESESESESETESERKTPARPETPPYHSPSEPSGAHEPGNNGDARRHRPSGGAAESRTSGSGLAGPVGGSSDATDDPPVARHEPWGANGTPSTPPAQHGPATPRQPPTGGTGQSATLAVLDRVGVGDPCRSDLAARLRPARAAELAARVAADAAAGKLRDPVGAFVHRAYESLGVSKADRPGAANGKPLSRDLAATVDAIDRLRKAKR